MERQWNSGMEQPDRPHLFGIRHLSPSGAWHLRKFLDEIFDRLDMKLSMYTCKGLIK